MKLNKKILICFLFCLASILMFSVAAAEQKPDVKFTFDKSSYNAGELISVQYEITGYDEDLLPCYYHCVCQDNDYTISIKHGQITSLNGTLQFKADIGQKVFVEFEIYISPDNITFRSDDIKLTGGKTTDPISVKFTFDKTSYKPGEKVTVKYKITGGSGDYQYNYDWIGDSQVIINPQTGYCYYTASSGTFSGIPEPDPDTKTIGISIRGSDSDGRAFVIFSQGIPISSSSGTSLTKATIGKIRSQVYTGDPIKPKVTVKLGSKTLVKGTDYKVSYKNNKAIGTATVKITGTGKYSGTLTTTFEIIPKPVTLSSISSGSKKLTVKWKKSSGITGYQVEYSRKKDFSGSTKITVKGASTLKKAIKNLKAGKTYYVRIRAYKTVSGKNYYSKWSSVLSKKTK